MIPFIVYKFHEHLKVRWSFNRQFQRLWQTFAATNGGWSSLTYHDIDIGRALGGVLS